MTKGPAAVMSEVPHSQLATKLALTMVAKYTPISDPNRFGFELSVVARRSRRLGNLEPAYYYASYVTRRSE